MIDWTIAELRLLLGIISQWRGYPFRRTGKPAAVAPEDRLQDLRLRILEEKNRRVAESGSENLPTAASEGVWRWIREERERRGAAPSTTPREAFSLSTADRLLLVDLLDRFIVELRERGEQWAADEFEIVMDAPLAEADALRRRLLT